MTFKPLINLKIRTATLINALANRSSRKAHSRSSTNSNIAICYHGPPRSLRKVFGSHHKHILSPLRKSNIAYKIFVHTWNCHGPQIINEQEISTAHDYEAYNLLAPHRIHNDDQDLFLETVKFSDYFCHETWREQGDNPATGEWRPGLIRNYLCSLESQKRVTAMVTGDFKYVLYIRPDIEFINDLNCNQITRLKTGQIMIPDFDSYEGFNDRLSIMTTQTAKLYGSRIDWLASFRREQGRIVSEKYTKYFIRSNNLRPVFSSIRFSIVRP